MNGGEISAFSSTKSSFSYQGRWIPTGLGVPIWAGTGDFNGDGKSDLAWYDTMNGGEVTVFTSTGSGFSYQGRWVVTGLGPPIWAAVGDFNGDGKSDLAWYDTNNGGEVTVFTSTGSSFSYQGRWVVTGLGPPIWAGVGDFNGDGKSDLAWYDTSSGGEVTVFTSTGSGFSYQGRWIATGLGRPIWAGVGDFNGDGKSDLAWYDTMNGGEVTVFTSTGSGFSYQGRWIATGLGVPTWAGVGDFNGDGKSDLAWYDTMNGGEVTVFTSTGSGFSYQGRWINSGLGVPVWAGVGEFSGGAATPAMPDNSLGLPFVPSTVSATAGADSATVNWSQGLDGGSPISSYTVTASPGGASTTVGAGNFSAVVTGLTGGTSYTFTVTATNTTLGAGYPSAPSNAVVPLTPQNITFTSTAPSNAFVGGPTYSVAATGGSSGNPVMFTIDPSSSSVCSISGSTVTFVSVGMCAIDANQNGNGSFAPASQAQQSFNVSQAASLVITTTSPLPDGKKGVSYTASLTGSGGTTPYSWKRISGKLPNGLNLIAHTGVISGKPKRIGTFRFTVVVTDTSTPTPQTASKALLISIK